MQNGYLRLVAGLTSTMALRPPPALSKAGRHLSWLMSLTLLFAPAGSAQQSAVDFQSLVQGATAAREENDLPRAIEMYRQAVALNGGWSDGWWYLGLLQYATDSYVPARDALTHFIQLSPNAGPAIALRGLCEFELGEYPSALQDVERGIAAGAANDPHNQEILLYHEALLRARTGDFEGAIDAYARFVKTESTNPELFVAIGLAGLQKPLLPSDLPADQVPLFKQTGQAGYAYLQGDQSAAEQAFEKLFQRYPTTPNLHYFYAYLLLAVDPAAASAQLRDELQVAPTNEAALLLAGWADMLQSKYKEGLTYARRALEIHPGMPMAELEMGRCLVETGEVRQGIQYLDKIDAVQPNNLEVHLAYVVAYEAENRPADARRERLLCLKLARQEVGVGSQ